MPTEFEFEVRETVVNRTRYWIVCDTEDEAWERAAIGETDNEEHVEDLRVLYRDVVRLTKKQDVES